MTQRRADLQQKVLELHLQHLKSSLELLQHLQFTLSELIQRNQSLIYESGSQLLIEKHKAMSLKLKVIKYQILRETYSSSKTKALKFIRNQQDGRLRQLELDHQTAKQHVQRFRSFGQAFNQLVAEYVAILKEIKEKQWAINRLKVPE